MNNINITVQNRIAVADADALIICNNEDFRATFAFDDEWSAIGQKVARIRYDGKYQEVIFTGNTCILPPADNVNYAEVGVHGGGIVSTPAVVPCKRSIICPSESNKLPSTVYSQLLGYYTEIIERTENVVEATDAANTAAATANAATETTNAATERALEAAAHYEDNAPVIELSTVGDAVFVRDSAERPLRGLTLYGRSAQNGTPALDAPVEIVSIGNLTVSVYGKNLLENTIATGEVEGVTRTLNDDGSFALNGTATKTHGVGVGQVALSDGNYILTGATAEIPLPLWGHSVKSGEWVQHVIDYGQGVAFEADGNVYDRYLVQYHITNGSIFSKQTFFPMIRPAKCENGEFEPYKEAQTVALSRTLPGIPVASGGNYTDADGQQWICDEVDFARGVYVQRVQTITIDENSSIATDGIEHNPWRKYAWIDNAPKKAPGYPGWCDRLQHKDSVALINGNTEDDAGFNVTTEYNCVYFNVAYLMSADTVEAAKAVLTEKPLTVMYVIETPIETALTGEEIAAYTALYSNYPNTTVLNDGGAGMAVKYAADTKTYIDNKFAALEAAIANDNP